MNNKQSTFLRIFCCFFALPIALRAQTDVAPKAKIAVLNIDAKGFTLDPVQMGDLTRIELDKLGLYEVLDRYDVAYLAEKEGLNFQNCYGKICLVETGRKLRSDKMLSGSVELVIDKIVVTFRLIDVGTESVEKSQVVQYLNIRNQVQLMIELTLRRMFGQSVDENLLGKLTKTDAYESAVSLPEVRKLNLSGPRMGMTFFSGDVAKRLADPRRLGGLDARPLMFQFGYQFETSYLNQGGLQALFEFIPILTGLDQGQVLPSTAILHGVRSNRNGFEFAFGPILYLNREAEGFYDNAGQWNLLSDWKAANPDKTPPADPEYAFDARGVYGMGSAFVFAFGKSFKSGKMNIPVNAFFIPNKKGHRFGLSVGFNGRG